MIWWIILIVLIVILIVIRKINKRGGKESFGNRFIQKVKDCCSYIAR